MPTATLTAAPAAPADALAAVVALLAEEEWRYVASQGRCHECGHSSAFHYTDDYSLHGYYFCNVCPGGNCDGDESDSDDESDGNDAADLDLTDL